MENKTLDQFYEFLANVMPISFCNQKCAENYREELKKEIDKLKNILK